MIVHKKCTEKCQEKTLCTREGPRNRSIPDEPWKPMTAQQQQLENQKNKIQDDKEPPARTGGLLSKFRKDPAPTVKKTLGRNSGTSPPPDRKSLASTPNHSPKARRKKSLPETQSSGDTFDESSKLHATTAGLPRTRSSTSLQVLINQNASPTLKPHEVIVKPEDKALDHSDDSDNGTQGSTSKSKVRMNVSNFDEEIVTNAKEKGKELLSHLSLEERREKLDTMVSMLQEQIDQATEAKSQLSKKEKEVIDAATKKLCQNRIRMTDEQIERLMIQLLHYCAGLQHCLDLEEEERQKVEQAIHPHPVSLTQQSVPLPSVVTTLITSDDCDSGSGGDIDDEFEDMDCSNDSNIVIVGSNSGDESVVENDGQRLLAAELESPLAVAASATNIQQSPSPSPPPPLPPLLTASQISEKTSGIASDSTESIDSS